MPDPGNQLYLLLLMALQFDLCAELLSKSVEIMTVKHLHGLNALNGRVHDGLLGRGEHGDGRWGAWDLKRGLSHASHGVLGWTLVGDTREDRRRGGGALETKLLPSCLSAGHLLL